MPLYKATATVTVYFHSEQKNMKLLLMEADDYLRDELHDQGPDSDPNIVKIDRREKPVAGWDEDSLVYGMDEPENLRTMMIRAEAETRALTAEQPAEKKELH